MYDELVNSLRRLSDWSIMDFEDNLSYANQIAEEAADAIEELQKDLERSKEYEAFWEKEANEALRKFQVAIASKPRWISVTERLPEFNENVVVYSAHSGLIRIDANIQFDRNATHWMPLPEPPKEE